MQGSTAAPTRPRTRSGSSEACIAVDLFRAQHEGAAGIARRQRERFLALVAHARRHSLHYQQRYRGVPEGDVALDLLPPVTKPELMADFDRWVTDPRITRASLERFVADPAGLGEAYLGRYFACMTSGTTGQPALFVHDASAIAVNRALVLRLDATWLSPLQWLALARRGMRWASVVGTGAHFAGVGWMEFEQRRSRWRRRAYRTFSVQRPLASLTSDLDAFDPAIITGYPSALLALAQEQEQGRLHVRPTLVELAGESTTPAERARIAAALGGMVRDAYASSEFQMIAIECRQGWLHVMADWVILEPVDAHRRPSPPGKPSDTVLLTNLANRVQPIIRYDLGDSVLARGDACPCGSPMPAIRVAGRRDDVLRLAGADGRIVEILPLAVGTVVERVPGVHRFQVVQEGSRCLRVRVEPVPRVPVEQVWPAMATALSKLLADMGAAPVELLLADERPTTSAGKLRHVIAAP